MKYFRVRYKLAKKRSSITFEAAHKGEALKLFRTKELGVPLNIQEISEPFGMKYERFKSRFSQPIKNRRVKDESYIVFLDQLSTMLDAGIPFITCLDECDCLIALGCRFSDRTTGKIDEFAPNAIILFFRRV